MDETTGYVGRHRGIMPALTRISGSTVWSPGEGLYRYRNTDTDSVWFSTTGNRWHATPAEALAGRP